MNTAKLVAGIAALTPIPALACMCVSYTPDNAAEMEHLVGTSEFIATVVVTEVTDLGGHRFEAVLNAEDVIKGSAGQYRLRQDFSTLCVCDPRMQPGKRYLVFLAAGEPAMRQTGPVLEFPYAEQFLPVLRKMTAER